MKGDEMSEKSALIGLGLSVVWVGILFGVAGSGSDLEAVDPETCFMCHSEVKELWDAGKHKAKLNCIQCHSDLSAHAESSDAKPVTHLDPANCGKCHQDQFASFFTVNHKKPARVEKSLYTERSPNPLWDKLMMGHGFTKEHNAIRSHAYMLIDHLVVDRAYGGRFQPKSGWQYTVERPPAKVWDVLEDNYPDTKDHRQFIRESAAAANPVCLQCKTTDNILKWKFMGEKDSAAKWDRTSNAVELAKDLRDVVGCIHCHDPHANKPRIVRDALIQALTRPEGKTLWHNDPHRTGIKVIDFRDFRKIALLDRYDAKLLCGQCHVEYNCNPGINPRTKEKAGMADARTNHFPFQDVFQIYDHYNQLEFRDFKHALTGGLLFKAQHPDAEVFWNSKHAQAGVGCNDCHMPKVKSKEGRALTSHWQTSPRNRIEDTCLKCHPQWTSEEALYIIDSIQRHIKGKTRKAEFWLATLIDQIVEAKKAGVDESILHEAQEQHQKAHILWEWWTAENSDGYHHPEQARESLARSVEESKKGIEILTKAMKER
jgi:formate-dependent nitrite reductase cytochrome c552 subunit